MARINLDDKLKSDVRFDLLATNTELVDALMTQATWRRRLIIGALVDQWFFSYHISDVVTEDQLGACLQVSGKLAADALIACGLAVVVTRKRSGTPPGRLLRIKGVRERAGYLQNQSESGRKGGIKSGESRRSKRRSESDGSASRKPEAKLKPPDPAPPLAPDPDPAPPLAHAPDPAPDRAASPPPSDPDGGVYVFPGRDSRRSVGAGYGEPASDTGTETGFVSIAAAKEK